MLAEKLIAFVLGKVKTWREENPGSTREKDVAREAWTVIIKTLGPLGQKLRSVALSCGDDATISEDENGVLFEL